MTVLRLRSGELEWREVDGEIIALVGSTAMYVATNAAGALLWRRLVDGATQSELVAEIIDVYGVDPRVAAEDVADFLDSLKANGLLAA